MNISLFSGRTILVILVADRIFQISDILYYDLEGYVIGVSHFGMEDTITCCSHCGRRIDHLQEAESLSGDMHRSSAKICI